MEFKLTADYVFIGGPVITADKKNSVQTGLAVKGNEILFVGDEADAKKLIGEETKVIDLAGRSLVPGFIDSHLHMGVMGANSLAIDCRSPGVSSIEDIKKLIAERAKITPKGQWIRGWGYDHSKLAEKRHPNRWDLDEAAPDHPVMLTRVCAHISAHNSKSLEIMGITDESEAPPGGVYMRENGHVNGVLLEYAHMQAMKASMLTKEELLNAIELANDMLVKEGITSLHDSGGYGFVQMGAFQDAAEQKRLKVRVYSMIFSFVENLDFNNTYLGIGLHTGFGNERFKIGPAKLMIDGSSSGPTAATLKEYASDPGNYGILSMKPEDVDEFVLRAHKAGFQVTSHAVGDRAVTVIVDAIEKAMKAFPRENCRHRIEHCAMINDELLERIKALGIVPILNPIFLYEFGDGYMVNYGKERAYRMFAAKSFLDKGVLAAGSSDCPITFSNPILNMHLACNRTTQTGQVLNKKECIGVMDALRMFTYNGAYASFEEDIKGTLEEGKLADLVVLSEDLTKVKPERLKDVVVDMTFIDGENVYERK
ncbi:MAG: amidohydrolase [Bacillota bacterium]|nr:amidohydrolase [Bacillota bacterium]